MRKIETKEALEKKKKRNQIILGSIMVFLLTFSYLGYSIMSRQSTDTSTTKDSGLEFYRENSQWKITIDEEEFAFQYLPSEVSNINTNISTTLGNYAGKTLYFVNPNEGYSEILTNIANYVQRYQEACVENQTCTGDVPTKTCDDNLIIFEQSNETKVYSNNNCIYITGDSIKGSDAFLYKILGII